MSKILQILGLISEFLSPKLSDKCPHATSFESLKIAQATFNLAGLAIYAASGLRSGSAAITTAAFTACGGWQSFLKNEMRKLDILHVVSNVSLVAETRCRRGA